MSKSKIFGIGVPNCELELLARYSNCSIGSFPFIYLGLPGGASMARVRYWNLIIEKFQARLSKWKASNLSFGGRLTLCKVVLSSLSTFYFSMYKAPVKVIKTLEKIRMRFFWGGDETSKKMAWISWDKILADKDRGGLGLGSLKGQNLALLGKWWRRFKNYPDSMWAEAIKSIYGVDGCFDRPSVAKRKSGCWGTIANISKFLERDGVSFSNHFHRSLNSNGALKWSWSLEPSGVFSVRSLRCHIDNLYLPDNDGIWICHGDPESEKHIFLECPVSKEVRQLICKWWRLLDYPLVSIRDMLQCKGNVARHQRLVWIHEAIMLTFIWVIWKYRNLRAHSHAPNSKSIPALVFEVKSLSNFWINARKKKGQTLRWSEWCSDPILECYSRL
ncbi:uncharacterized protein LOC111879881 [Lactuca sativa]|uniref:uncharacterized protein LOC111879881 n=1 Tax=Lactuca sativa TaxID=4236 RepID=UPI000CD905A2|nr:uncharacterized protein LOC111879881 [Lactuca sativa]